MVRRWSYAGALAALSVAPTPSLAQSLSVEEQAEPPPAQPAPSQPPPPPPKPATIVMPVARSTPLAYPEGAEGEASVVLELTLSREGNVTLATAIEGDEPFASLAVTAAKSWSFEPATRDGQPIAAKIRFLVQFKPPAPEPAPAAEPAPDAAPAATPAAPGAPAAPPSKPAEPSYEIVVTGERAPIRHQLGQVEVARMPGAFGDPYRAIEGLPGVVPIVSGLPYFYVRGAPPGNVGYFFDGIPVPYLYHFAAGPGVFQPGFVDHVDLYPGAYPVRYGRFAGAIVAGELAPPGYRLRGEWRVRLIDSGAMVEAPLFGGRGSIMLGGRFSYTGLVLSLIVPEVTVGYWDYQMRARYDLSAKDSVEVLTFGSGDYVTNTEQHTSLNAAGNSVQVERKQTIVDVNFHRVDLRWDHRLEQGNWRNALMLGRDRTGLDNGNVNVYDYMVGVRSEFQQQLSAPLRVRAGADVLLESLQQEFTEQNDGDGGPASVPVPGDMPPPLSPGTDSDSDADETDFGFTPLRKDFTAGLYADLVWDVTPRVRITPGLRFDLFVSGKQLALGFDPRVTAEFQVSKKLKLVQGLALVHQAPSFVAPVPGFKPSLEGGLQTAVQHSAGANYELPAGLTGSLAFFQSAFIDMTDPISLFQLQEAGDVSVDDPSDFRTNGHAYGMEVMIRRSLSRKLGGFVSYTLSRSLRFAGKLSGPATTDRTHVLNVAASYDLGRDWRVGGRLLYYTGVPAQVAYLEAARHPPRTPPFWRVDWKLEKRWYIRRPDRWWGISFEVLNTTLNKEQLTGSCNAYTCKYEEIGPVTVPAIAFEGAL